MPLSWRRAHCGPAVDAARRIGRLIEIIDGVAIAVKFERRAKKAATELQGSAS